MEEEVLQARKFLEEKPERVEMWENGSPSQQMLARCLKKIAGVE